MTISRRTFLNMLAASGAAMAVPASVLAHNQWTPRPEDLIPGGAFRHGVASGDPLKHRVILWTRATPRSQHERIPVKCRIAKDPKMNDVIGHYHALASADTDFTVKLDASGLKPGQTYYYQFYARG